MLTKLTIAAATLLLCLMHGGGARIEANPLDGYRLSEPVVHENLAIYFIHGQSRGGPIPLTLQEALAKRVIEVREIGQVNELEVENTGAGEVFIQAGDIVKGGQQDRVLSVSLVLPPHSGATSIPSFCVESGRWSARGSEDVGSFSSANAALPSRVAKIAMAKTAPTRRDGTPSDDMATRQREIWGSVSQIQGKLSANLGAPVAAPRSQTSLQLSLENPRLEGEQERYVSALHALGEQDNDIVGYAFAINGRLNSADIYPSNGLFRKMWPKLLRASATEAIAARDAANEPAPPKATITEFFGAANSTRGIETSAAKPSRVEIRESSKALVLEARPAAAPASAWVHRNYLAK
jgi:hypothetical protein